MEMQKALEVERENLDRTTRQLHAETDRANSLQMRLDASEEQLDN